MGDTQGVGHVINLALSLFIGAPPSKSLSLLEAHWRILCIFQINLLTYKLSFILSYTFKNYL